MHPLSDPEQLAVEIKLARWQAAREWDPAKGRSREVWEATRVRFAIREHRRRHDHLRRALRRRVEMAGETPLPLLAPLQLEDAWLDDIAAPAPDDPSPGFPRLIRALRLLRRSYPREAWVIGMYYGRGVNMRVIAQELAVSPQRVGYLLGQGLRRLRSYLNVR